MNELHHVQRPGTRVPRYIAPVTLEAALALKAEQGNGARAIAGGTDLVVELDRGAHTGVDLLIDLSRIAGADTIDASDNEIRLGPATTHHDVVANGACTSSALALAQACLEVGSPQLRNRATIVGNLVTASPANDTISALVALGAVVEVRSTTGSRRQPVGEFVTAFRQTTLEPDELVTGLSIPRLPERRSIFVKSGLRRAQAISVVHVAVAVRFDGDVVTEAVVALGSVAPTIITVPAATELLAGRRLDADAAHDMGSLAAATAAPIDDLRATADYRRTQVAVMVERAIVALGSGSERSRWPTRQPYLRAARASITATEPSVVDEETEITAVVNGAAVTAGGAVGVTLLDWLRDGAGCTGVKEGCAEGECGACTVHLDGVAVMSCLVPAARAARCEVTTVEGLATDGALAPIQRAFVEHNAVQCGFCTPGFLMSCASLLSEIPDPTLDEVRAALAGNLCRCTGYRAIEAAVSAAAAVPVEVAR
jgi:carbon-monoxide dehydrogenase medium subunit